MTTSTSPGQAGSEAGGPEQGGDQDEILRSIERRVLWLSTAIIDHANRVRVNPSGLKVGGH